MARLIHPSALIGLAHVLSSAYPKMSMQTAIDNAMEIIEGLHKMDLEVGPISAFGPQSAASTAAQPFDALDLAADMVEKDMGRKPWLPDGMN